jgi:hypothetical protein
LYKDFYGEANSELAHHLLHTHYAPGEGDFICSHIRKKADSAFVTREFTICTCESCSGKGSKELYNKLDAKVKKMKMDPFIEV